MADSCSFLFCGASCVFEFFVVCICLVVPCCCALVVGSCTVPVCPQAPVAVIVRNVFFLNVLISKITSVSVGLSLE